MKNLTFLFLIVLLFGCVHIPNSCDIPLPEKLTYDGIRGDLCFFITGEFGKRMAYNMLVIVPNHYDWAKNLYFDGDGFVPLDLWQLAYKAKDTCVLKRMLYKRLICINGEYIYLKKGDTLYFDLNQYYTFAENIEKEK